MELRGRIHRSIFTRTPTSSPAPNFIYVNLLCTLTFMQCNNCSVHCRKLQVVILENICNCKQSGTHYLENYDMSSNNCNCVVHMCNSSFSSYLHSSSSSSSFPPPASLLHLSLLLLALLLTLTILVRAVCVRCHGTKCPLLTAFFLSSLSLPPGLLFSPKGLW